MNDMNEFQLFHTYNRLVRQGFADALTCSCGMEYVTGVSPEQDLILYCYQCNTKTRPGVNMLAKVKGVVGEWML
jgi:hypothetical protein